jgi:hypothetical protein
VSIHRKIICGFPVHPLTLGPMMRLALSATFVAVLAVPMSAQQPTSLNGNNGASSGAESRNTDASATKAGSKAKALGADEAGRPSVKPLEKKGKQKLLPARIPHRSGRLRDDKGLEDIWEREIYVMRRGANLELLADPLYREEMRRRKEMAAHDTGM